MMQRRACNTMTCRVVDPRPARGHSRAAMPADETMAPPSLPSSQLASFGAQGYLRLEGFHAGAGLQALRNKVLAELKRLKAWDAGRILSPALRDLPAFQQVARLSALVKVPGLHEAVATPELCAFVGRLAGRTLAAGQGTQLLLSLPLQGAWTLQGLNWHVDVAAQPAERLPGIQAFVLLDDVAPRGGATLAVVGSHRFRARSPEAASLRELLKASTDPQEGLRQAGLAVLEMSGRAGDVFLMDMRLLHAPSINATRQLRMMATARFF